MGSDPVGWERAAGAIDHLAPHRNADNSMHHCNSSDGGEGLKSWTPSISADDRTERSLSLLHADMGYGHNWASRALGLFHSAPKCI
jgi:hypothetical protein